MTHTAARDPLGRGILLAVDPGYRSLGWAMLDIRERRITSVGSFFTLPRAATFLRLNLATQAVLERCNPKPEVIAVEDYTWIGTRSCNRSAFEVARMVGRVEAIAVTLVCDLRTLTRSEVLRGLGLRGRVPKSRVRKMIEPFCECPLSNEHEIDAAALAWVAARRLP